MARKKIGVRILVEGPGGIANSDKPAIAFYIQHALTEAGIHARVRSNNTPSMAFLIDRIRQATNRLHAAGETVEIVIAGRIGGEVVPPSPGSVGVGPGKPVRTFLRPLGGPALFTAEGVPVCRSCLEEYVFDQDAPFAHCGCGTSEWGHDGAPYRRIQAARRAGYCPRDTNGDGDCGDRRCSWCGPRRTGPQPMRKEVDLDWVSYYCPCGAGFCTRNSKPTATDTWLAEHKPHTNGKQYVTTTERGQRAYAEPHPPYTEPMP